MKKFILEHKEFYKIDDIVIIEYWYNDMLTPVKILKILGRKFLISHNIKESNIKNAPDELIQISDIIDIFRSNKN